jgi:hypothetical protein
VKNTYQVLNIVLGLPAKPVTPSEFVPRLASELDVSDQIRQRARTLAEVAESAGVAIGVQPAGFAGACLYKATVAGKARWGKMPVVAPVESDDGEVLLERGWEATQDEFERNLDRVSELSTEELMHNKGLARHTCHNLGVHRGPSLFLYDESGLGIRHREQLDSVLNSSEQLWIIGCVESP